MSAFLWTVLAVFLAVWVIRVVYAVAYHHGWSDSYEGRMNPVGWRRWLV